MIGNSYSGWLAHEAKWLNAYGYVAWWFAALTGALLAVALIILTAYARLIFIKGEAISKWKEVVDTINPLDVEFNKKRIFIRDLIDPVKNNIVKKRFIDCELIGPATINLRRGMLNRVTLFNCDIVVLKDKPDPVYNVVIIDSVEVMGGVISKCTVYIHKDEIKNFLQMGANIVTDH